MAGRTRRGARAIVVPAIVAVLGVGCSNDATPSPIASGPEPTTSRASGTPSATPSPGPTDWPAPERPASMDRDDVVGAKAAAQYFIELYPYVYATGDLDEWRAMSHEECVFCESVEANVVELHSEGGYGTGGEIVVEDVRASEPNQETEFFRVGLRVTEGPSAEHARDGSELATTTGGAGYYLTALTYLDGSWFVRGVSAEEADL
ncbi:DUF6318 family protein [Georgenia wangjunii]|uniref:DUF6318 family protein n=1 Tax=Georgenia wangjunii TaxID=3117730 RepID=UPI002F267941